MKGFYELLVFFCVAVASSSLDWLGRNARSILFVVTLACLSYGFSLLHESLAFIVPSAVVMLGLILTELFPAGGGDA